MFKKCFRQHECDIIVHVDGRANGQAVTLLADGTMNIEREKIEIARTMLCLCRSPWLAIHQNWLLFSTIVTICHCDIVNFVAPRFEKMVSLRKNKAGYTAIRCVLAGTDSGFGQKRHFCIVSTRVRRTDGSTDGPMDRRISHALLCRSVVNE